jgi:ApeA-like protein
MMEEFHLDGTWWIPKRQDRKFVGTLTFDHPLWRCELSITSGIDFENTLMGNRKVRPKHDIILGETFDGQKVTLRDCGRGEWSRNVKVDLGRYSFVPTYVLLGEHFERPEDIIFGSIYITYSGKEVDEWIKRVQHQARVNSHDSAKVKIRDSHNISVLGKLIISTWSEREVQKQSRKEIPCIEIESLKEQSRWKII